MTSVIGRRWTISCFWNEDHVPADDFTRVVVPVMRMAQERIPPVEAWYGSGRMPPKDPPLLLTEQELAPGRRKGAGLEVSVSAWGGDPMSPVLFDAYICEGSHNFDQVHLLLPGPEDAPELWRGHLASDLLRDMLDLTPADRGFVTALAHHDAQPHPRDGVPLGWLSYFAVDPSGLPPLPSPATAEPLGTGTLISLGIPASSEVPTAHYEALRAVLEPTGILDPPLRRDERPRPPAADT